MHEFKIIPPAQTDGIAVEKFLNFSKKIKKLRKREYSISGGKANLGGEGVEKTPEERAAISVEVINLLSKKDCTIDEASEILNGARWTIEHTSKVQKVEWKPSADKP